jgi:multidrug efflux pump subunit AcrB
MMTSVASLRLAVVSKAAPAEQARPPAWPSGAMPIDILAQIGFVVLVGLAAKNAILIVEFARQRQDHNG